MLLPCRSVSFTTKRRSFVRLFVRLFVYWVLGCLFTQLQVGQSVGWSNVRSFVCSFVRSFVRSFVYWMVGCLFTQLQVGQSVDDLFFHRITHSSNHSCNFTMIIEIVYQTIQQVQYQIRRDSDTTIWSLSQRDPSKNKQ